MATLLRMKEHDTAPKLSVHLTDAGVPVDVTSAIEIRVIAQHTTDLDTHFSRVVTGDADGLVEMDWQATDTAVPGLLNIEFQIKWPDLTIQTFPGSSYIQVLIEQDLG